MNKFDMVPNGRKDCTVINIGLLDYVKRNNS